MELSGWGDSNFGRRGINFDYLKEKETCKDEIMCFLNFRISIKEKFFNSKTSKERIRDKGLNLARLFSPFYVENGEIKEF